MKVCPTAGCGRPVLCRGLCSPCYQKSRRPRRRTVEERYEVKVDRSAGMDACHPWIASRNVFGYGLFAHDGETLAARWAYRHFIGPLARHEVVRHTCDNRACQNRTHWIKGTQHENVLDAVERSRQHRPAGERNVKAKLTAAQVFEIRASELSSTELTAKYGVSRPTINSVRLRKTWRHI